MPGPDSSKQRQEIVAWFPQGKTGLPRVRTRGSEGQEVDQVAGLGVGVGAGVAVAGTVSGWPHLVQATWNVVEP